LVTENGKYIDQVLNHRSLHADSIQKNLTKDAHVFNKELLENRLLTYKDISANIDSYTREELVFGLMNLHFNLFKMGVFSGYSQEVIKIIKLQLGVKSQIYFLIALLAVGVTGKGHYFLNKSKQR